MQRKQITTADLEVSWCALLHGELGVKLNSKSRVFLEEHLSFRPFFLQQAHLKLHFFEKQVLKQV